MWQIVVVVVVVEKGSGFEGFFTPILLHPLPPSSLPQIHQLTTKNEWKLDYSPLELVLGVVSLSVEVQDFRTAV